MAIKFCIFSDGKHTFAKLGDQYIGPGIKALTYMHDASEGNELSVDLQIDLETFKYESKEKWEQMVKMLQELPDVEDPEYEEKYRELLL